MINCIEKDFFHTLFVLWLSILEVKGYVYTVVCYVACCGGVWLFVSKYFGWNYPNNGFDDPGKLFCCAFGYGTLADSVKYFIVSFVHYSKNSFAARSPVKVSSSFKVCRWQTLPRNLVFLNASNSTHFRFVSFQSLRMWLKAYVDALGSQSWFLLLIPEEFGLFFVSCETGYS